MSPVHRNTNGEHPEMTREPSKTMFPIGEFSKITGLTVKTLRFYHEEALLPPAVVDPQSGYRYYDHRQIETARAIAFLRTLEFPIADIRQILADQGDDHLLDALERQKSTLQQKLRALRKTVRSLDDFIQQERQAAMSQETYEVQEKVLEPTLIGGIRMKGRYCDCGKGFSKVCRALGRYASGKPMILHYDTEFKETDADFEPCIPLRQSVPADGISVRQLPGGKCVSLIHKGPYDQLGPSYARIFQYINAHHYKPLTPSREIYIKGPGMIFKGNPKNYLTEIQILVEDGAAT